VSELAGQVGEMARRSVLQTLRQPAMLIFPVLFPLVLVAVNASGLDAATKIPGFPADTYLDFAIAVPFIQGSLFAMINAGSSLARDVETGFMRRLAMTPMRRTALLVGDLAGKCHAIVLEASLQAPPFRSSADDQHPPVGNGIGVLDCP
jgi:ABC-2 type transport system permease protein